MSLAPPSRRAQAGSGAGGASVLRAQKRQKLELLLRRIQRVAGVPMEGGNVKEYLYQLYLQLLAIETLGACRQGPRLNRRGERILRWLRQRGVQS